MSGPLLDYGRVKTAGLLVIGCEIWALFPSFSTVVQRIPQIVNGQKLCRGGSSASKTNVFDVCHALSYE
jgi:hypothetical protein